MDVSLRSIGNSTGMIIPKKLLDEFELTDSDTVKLVPTNEGILIKVEKQLPKFRPIEELFKGYEDDYFDDQEISWGKPVGEEIW